MARSIVHTLPTLPLTQTLSSLQEFPPSQHEREKLLEGPELDELWPEAEEPFVRSFGKSILGDVKP